MSYLSDIWGSRELLQNLTNREVRGKYRRTALGQLWSLANPIAAILIYTFIFSFLFRLPAQVGDPSGLNNYALWLVCGLLPWLFFNRVLTIGVDSLVANAGLIQKVYFPRIVLPLSLANATLFTWLLEMGVLVVALSLLGSFVLPWLPLLAAFMVVFALFSVGVAMLLSIANVYFRDLSYLLTIVLQFWFYLTPILYPVDMVATQSDRLGGLAGTSVTLLNLYQLNPVEGFIEIFRNLLYDNAMPELSRILIALAWAVGAFGAGVWLYSKKERQMAELL
ncbi:MAG: ABC transporter permease [Pontimonas sp.]|nr:ABC transporter permease [Pontimonas sp.]MCF8547352.1 ABC transporter permease [Pontimonas sp.]